MIDALGDGVEGSEVGDRVFISMGKGTFATTLRRRRDSCDTTPDEIDLTVGASFMQVYGTAWFAFVKRTTGCRPGEVVLVTGAGGGVGCSPRSTWPAPRRGVIAVASSENDKRAPRVEMGARR